MVAEEELAFAQADETGVRREERTFVGKLCRAFSHAAKSRGRACMIAVISKWSRIPFEGSVSHAPARLRTVARRPTSTGCVDRAVERLTSGNDLSLSIWRDEDAVPPRRHVAAPRRLQGRPQAALHGDTARVAQVLRE